MDYLRKNEQTIKKIKFDIDKGNPVKACLVARSGKWNKKRTDQTDKVS